MTKGRFTGWIFLTLGILLGSIDMVLAVVPSQSGLATADLWTLVTAQHPPFAESIMDLPAWMTFSLIGTTLLLTFRKKTVKRRLFL